MVSQDLLILIIQMNRNSVIFVKRISFKYEDYKGSVKRIKVTINVSLILIVKGDYFFHWQNKKWGILRDFSRGPRPFSP
jgi:hypothetical protein